MSPAPDSRPGDPLPVADDNVVRLLHQAPAPESPSPEFVRATEVRLLAVAAELARQRAPRRPPVPFRGPRSHLRSLVGVAALLAILALGLRSLVPTETPIAPLAADASTPPEPEAVRPGPVRDRLRSAPRPTVPAAERLAIGATLHTQAGERRRVRLADDSVVYLNEKTMLTCDDERRVTVRGGEVFVEVSARSAGDERDTFVVRTPQRVVEALGTKLAVRVDRTGTGVLVTQGSVRSDGVVVASGQELAPGADRATPAPRFSAALGWMRDLMEEAAGRLLPFSRYRGGALVAGPQGRETRLKLRKYHVDVHVEDGFARTTIDQTYFNPTGLRLEGTFHFPLPADASLSRLAMYVDGNLMEGGMVERDHGRAVFEQIVTRMQDPALLEWVDGSTFKMRVFPLEPYQEKRIILCYVQRLPGLHGRWTYRFPSGNSLGTVRDWSFQARIKDSACTWSCPSHPLKAATEGGDLVLRGSAHDVALDRDVVLELADPASSPGAAAVRFASTTQDGARYLMVRYRPALAGVPRRERRDWVFLVETSGDRTPLLARTQVEIVRTLLANAEPDDTFAVVTAGTRVRSFAPVLQPITPENGASALAFLEEAHLVGGLDLDRGLRAAAELLRQGRNPHLVHIGSALPVVGEKEPGALLRLLPERARYVGVAVGKHWNRAFAKQTEEKTDGYCTQINPDEAVAWRAFDLLATLGTPRLLKVRVEDAAGKVVFLSQDAALSQGEELCAVARMEGEKGPWPAQLVVRGSLAGEPFEQRLPVRDVRSGVGHLPRTWAKREIDRLLAEEGKKNREKIVALSKAMYVMTPFTSLLVLENEAMYKQYKVDRGRKDHWAPYACPAKIRVISEPPEKEDPVEVILPDEIDSRRPLEPLGLRKLSPLVSNWVNRLGPELDLSNIFLGNDSKGEDINYDVERDKQEFSVPGEVNPDAPPGIPGGQMDAPKISIPPPPSTGAIPLQQPDVPLRLPGAALDGRWDDQQVWLALIPLDLSSCPDRGHLIPYELRMKASSLWSCNERHRIIGLLEDHAPFVEEALADELIAFALQGAAPSKERRSVLLAALGYYGLHQRYDRAEAVFAELRTDPALARSPILWRLGALLALQAGEQDRALTRLEYSLSLEYTHLPRHLDLQAIRDDYRQLLALYEKRARSLRDRRQPVPGDLVKRVVRGADRWRSLDPDNRTACSEAAKVLRLLGADELARDYETTALIGAEE